MNKKFLAREILYLFGSLFVIGITFGIIYSWNWYMGYRASVLMKEHSKLAKEYLILNEYIEQYNISGITKEKIQAELKLIRSSPMPKTGVMPLISQEETIRLKEQHIEKLERKKVIEETRSVIIKKTIQNSHSYINLNLVLKVLTLTILSMLYGIRPLYHLLKWSVNTVRS